MHNRSDEDKTRYALQGIRAVVHLAARDYVMTDQASDRMGHGMSWYFPSTLNVQQGAHRALVRAVPIERPQFYGRRRAAEEIADALLVRTFERPGRTN